MTERHKEWNSGMENERDKRTRLLRWKEKNEESWETTRKKSEVERVKENQINDIG